MTQKSMGAKKGSKFYVWVIKRGLKFTNSLKRRGQNCGVCLITFLKVCLFWPCETKWCHGTGSTLVQVMAFCLTVQSHYLNQRWLITTKWGLVAFTWEQFHRKCSRHLSLVWVWKLQLQIQDYCCFSQAGPIKEVKFGRVLDPSSPPQ